MCDGGVAHGGVFLLAKQASNDLRLLWSGTCSIERNLRVRRLQGVCVHSFLLCISVLSCSLSECTFGWQCELRGVLHDGSFGVRGLAPTHSFSQDGMQLFEPRGNLLLGRLQV